MCNVGVMCEPHGALPPSREGETLPPYPPPSKSYPPLCETEVQGVLRTEKVWYSTVYTLALAGSRG